MWKRHAGFDVVAFQGSSSDPGPSYAHGLGKIPELKYCAAKIEKITA